MDDGPQDADLLPIHRSSTAESRGSDRDDAIYSHDVCPYLGSATAPHVTAGALARSREGPAARASPRNLHVEGKFLTSIRERRSIPDDRRRI